MLKTVASNKGGRAPKAGVRRYPSGQIVHSDRVPTETEEDIKATALEARMRRELGVDSWLAARGTPRNMRKAREKMDSQFLGYALGRLLMVGKRDLSAGITQDQHDAGDYFIWLYQAKGRITGRPSPNARAIDYGAIRGGLSTHAEDSPEWIADIKRRWEDMNRAIFELNMGGVYEAMVRVLIEDKDLRSLHEVGALRMGLNAVNKARGV